MCNKLPPCPSSAGTPSARLPAFISSRLTGLERHLPRREQGVRKHGVKRLRIMSSNGGSITAQAAGRLAIRTALSGPAGGVAGAFALAQRAGRGRLPTLDLGGTSTDVALCPGPILERDETLV